MRSFCFFLFFLFTLKLAGQNLPPIPERIVSIDCENKRTDDVLQDIATQGKFEFAWDGRLFDPAKPVTLHAHNISVRRALYLIFGNSVSFRIKGNYMILVAAPPPVTASSEPPKKKEIVISGYTTDLATGQPLPHVSVYDSVSLASALSDEYGHFSLKVNGSTQSLRLKASRENYNDTFFIVTPSANTTQDVFLRNYPAPETLPVHVIRSSGDSIFPIDSTQVFLPAKKGLERFPMIDSIAGYDLAMQARNLKETFQRGGQASVLPYVSTNGLMSGTVVNKFSFNLIGGYTGGTNGAEIGAGFNIDRGDVRWVQLAGGFNVVGGNVRGVQASGGFNFTAGTLTGIQLSGGTNILLDTLHGFQVSGGSNFIRGYVDGIQVAGGCNFASNDLDGFQLAGGSNFTIGDVKKAQLAAGMNYARSVKGVQASGGMNFSLRQVTGFQVTGGLNYAGSVNGVQVAGACNVSPGTLTGAQIAPFNIAKNIRGVQLGVFNFADTCSGGTIIGILSFVPKGMHELEIATNEKGFLSLSFRTGIHKFYNILSAGIDPHNSASPAWTAGYGFGHRFLIRPHFNLALDLLANHVSNGSFSRYTNEWAQLIFTAEWRPFRTIAIAGGPVFNYFISGAAADSLAGIHPEPLYSGVPASGYRAIGWIGGTLAIRFF